MEAFHNVGHVLLHPFPVVLYQGVPHDHIQLPLSAHSALYQMELIPRRRHAEKAAIGFIGDPPGPGKQKVELARLPAFLISRSRLGNQIHLDPGRFILGL